MINMLKNVRFASFITGALLIMVAFFMLFPAFTDIYFQHSPQSFFEGALITSCFALIFIKVGKIEHIENVSMSIITTIVWVAVSIFSCIPIFLETDLTITDAIFESVSGITTTGATVLSNIEKYTHGILLWRTLLHFFGGAGIVLTGILIFPIFKNVNLNAILSSELHNDTLSMQRNVFYNPLKTAILIFAIYLILNLLCFISYLSVGMPLFDSICHAMSTVSTGGFANYDKSIGFYNNSKIEAVCCIFMILSAIPFGSYAHLPKKISLTDQGKFYLKFVVLSCTFSTIAIFINEPKDGFPLSEVIRSGFFNTISFTSTTGFFTSDYGSMHYMWVIGGFIMLVGGCSQSTSGGMKISRFMIAIRSVKNTTLSSFNPEVIKVLIFDGSTIEQKVIMETFSYMFLYLFTTAIAAALVSMTGLDFSSSVSSAIASISNSGFGFGSVSENYSSLTGTAKIILSCTMIMGRLENLILSVLFIFIMDPKQR